MRRNNEITAMTLFLKCLFSFLAQGMSGGLGSQLTNRDDLTATNAIIGGIAGALVPIVRAVTPWSVTNSDDNPIIMVSKELLLNGTIATLLTGALACISNKTDSALDIMTNEAAGVGAISLTSVLLISMYACFDACDSKKQEAAAYARLAAAPRLQPRGAAAPVVIPMSTTPSPGQPS